MKKNAALGLTTSEYGRVDLGADELEDFLDSHPDETGFSLTMPLKDRLVKLAAERGWSIDDTAALTGAGNTVVRSGEQTQVANTDVRGIVGAIAPHLSVAEGEGTRGAGVGRATILGAGATAASALVACRDLGITEVEFLVRSPDRARRVVELAEQIGLSASVAPLERIGPSAIVISTLPAEAAPQLEWDASFTAGDVPSGDAHSGNVPSGVALDVAYAEASSFLAAAAAHGLLPVDGTAMLVEQAVAQSEMFVAAAAMPFDLPTGQELRDRISAAMYSALRDTAAASRD